MEKYRKLFERIGFNIYESTIYLSLLKSGPRHISDIAKDTGYHRPLIYKMVRSLRERGHIISVPSKGKRSYYHISDPHMLSEELESTVSKSLSLIDELSRMYDKQDDRPVLTIKEGVEEIRSIHSDLIHSLPKGSVYHRYSSSDRNFTERSLYVPEDYFELQKKKELERFVITSEHMKQYRVGNPLREVVSIPGDYDLFDDNITKLIYGNKVAIIDYDSVSGWVIESERFAEYERKIFTLLFRLLKKQQ